MSNPDNSSGSAADGPFPAGIDDIVILPLAAIAVAIVRLLRAIFNLLINIIDVLFPIVLQILRFPLFTLRILGDGIAALTRGVIRLLPVGGTKRAAWREAVSVYWAWLRGKLSYKAFEEWLHHAFESGMAWVFRTCKALTPSQALLVLAGAVLWLPVSFGIATLMHVVLVAKALVWPAWLQLLHPLATIIAKSKLLVLPVYPAAWPRAKEHPLMQALLAFGRYVRTLHLVRKTGYRYRQTDHAAAEAGVALGRGASAVGLSRLWSAIVTGFNTAAAWLGRTLRAAAARSVALLSKAPLVGGVVQRYAAQYDEVNRQPPSGPVSERMRGFLARWSVKFTAKYYEDKEREEAAKGAARA